MAVAVGNTSTGNWAGNYPFAYTQTHTVSSGATAILVFFYDAASYSYTPTCTIGGTTATLIGQVNGTGSQSNRTIWAWYLASPTAGSQTISISMANQYADNGVCIAVDVSGTGTNPLGNSNFVFSAAQTVSPSITSSTATSMVFGFAGAYFATMSLTSSSPTATNITSNTTNSNLPVYLTSQSPSSSGSTVTETWTVPYNYNEACLVEVLPAAGGGGGGGGTVAATVALPFVLFLS